MANRPGTLCNLQSGKSIGAQSNFAQTFNWIVACMKNLKAGRGLRLSWPSDDTPEISLDGGSDGDGGVDSGTTNAVYDVQDNYDSSTGMQSLTISYTDDREEKTIDLAGGDVKFNGTDATYTSGKEFTFASEENSNVTVNCSGGTLKIGVYYS